MKKVYALLFTLLISGCASVDEPLVRRDLPGWWDWASKEQSCVDGPSLYTFSKNGDKLLVYSTVGATFGHGEPKNNLEYVIKEEVPHVLRMKGIGEHRTTDKGNLVTWDLVMKDPDTFCWHRTDWRDKACTKNLVRCKN